jgi:glycosyltransferase involved in cell wall biosynthesis
MIPLATELQQRGHQVTIVAPPYTNPEDSGLDEVVRGVLLRNVRLVARSKVIAALTLPWRLFRMTMGEKPDLVHLFKPKGYSGLAAILLLLLRKAGLRLPPVILDTDDWEGRGGMNDILDYSPLEKRVFAAQEQWLLKNADAVTVASRGLEEQASCMGIPPERILYLPNCVTATSRGDAVKIRKRLGIKTDEPVLLLYTRFFEFDQEFLYKIFEEVWRRLPTVRFLVIGKGRYGEGERLMLEARCRGFAESIIMAGWVEPAEIPDYLAAGDVAIYPFAETLVNRCKCPAKLTELLMAEVPVIGNRVGQVAEYIQDAVSGILCNPGDWETMAAKSLELLAHQERRRALGRAGRQHLTERFNWHEYAGYLEKFYGEHVTI